MMLLLAIYNNINKYFIMKDILEFLPHRYPILLIDKLIKFTPNKNLVALKNISLNEWCFQGHFPNHAIFPGVLILESMAQASGILGLKSLNKIPKNAFYYLIGIDHARFKKIVYPGDQMFIEVNIEKKNRLLIRFKGIVTVNDNIVCKADITCFLKQHK